MHYSIMKQIIKRKILWLSLILFTMGTAFRFIENTYYQYIDENGYLVESWFMPLSFLCIFLGGMGLFFVFVKIIWFAINKKV